MNSNLRPTSLVPLPHAVRNRPRPCPFYALALVAFVLGAFPVRGELRLEITPSGTNALLIWSNSAAALEQSLVLTGAWNEVTGAISPYLVLTPILPASIVCGRRLAGRSTTFTSRPRSPPVWVIPLAAGCTSPENPNFLSTGGSAQDNGLGSVFLHTAS